MRQFQALISKQIEQHNIVGLSVAFVKDGYQWANGYGYAELENQVPAAAESSYRLASVTKPMTAAGILKLVEMGKVDLDADVQAYVPYFIRKRWPVTIRHLLGHLSGISHYRNYPVEGGITHQVDTREAIGIFEE